MTTVRKPAARRNTRGAQNAKTDLEQLSEISLDEIFASPENDEVYGETNSSDPEFLKLADSIRERGVLEPLVIDLDGYLASGHRRYHAAIRAGLKRVPCRVLNVRRVDDLDGWCRLLVAFNGYRNKDAGQQFREGVVESDPEDIYRALLRERAERQRIKSDRMVVRDRAEGRKKISAAKRPFLAAVCNAIESLRSYWPLSDRQIHYQMLNVDVRIHASKPASKYRNNHKSYRALVDILTRARIDVEIPFSAIEDPTRPVEQWRVWKSPAEFVREHLDEFLKGFWRDPLQSQPSYVEVHAEKNTVLAACKRAAAKYGITVSSGRGFASIPCRWDLIQRYRASGKDRLVILFAADYDPEGLTIPHAFTRSLIDDFGLQEDEVVAQRVALTAEQIERFHLPANLTAKESSTHYARFVAETGSTVAYELESLPPDALETLIVEAIEGVVDRELLNAEIAAERDDAAKLDSIRRQAKELLRGIVP